MIAGPPLAKTQRRADLLPPRFAPPGIDRGLERGELLEQCYALTAPNVALLEAPAGYGKTRLLHHWEHAALLQRQCVAWIGFQASERTAAGMARAMVAVLAAAGISKNLLRPIERSSPHWESSEHFVEALVLALEAHRRPVLLILDNYHLASSEACDQLLGLLVGNMARNLTLVVATRQHCRIPLSGALLEGRLQRFDRCTLSFTKAETRAFFEGALSPHELQNVCRSLEGWPAALRIARICQSAWHRTIGDPRHAPEFQRLMFEYCRSEVLRSVSESELDLLTDVAILDAFGADACDALGARDDSARILGALSDRETFIEPADDTHGTYQIGGLLRDYFLKRGSLRGSHELAARHSRAARFFEAHADSLSAMRHYLASGDAGAAAAALERLNPLHIAVSQGDERAAVHLELIPRGELLNFPRLAVCRAYLDFKQGLIDKAQHMLDAVAARSANFSADRAGGNDRKLAIEALHVELVREIYQCSSVSSDYLASVSRRIDVLQEDSDLSAVSCHIAGILHMLRGDLEAAERHFLVSERLTAQDPAPWRVFWLKYHFGALALARGRMMDARYFLQAGLRLWRASYHTYASYRALAQLLLAEIDYECDVLTEAQIKLDESLYVLENGEGWFDPYAGAYELAMMLHVHGRRSDKVESLLARPEAGDRVGSVLKSFLHVARVQYHILFGRHEAAEAIVAEHDMRARWLSPSAHDHLSYRERDLMGLCLARLALHAGRWDEGLAVIEKLGRTAQTSGRMRTVVKAAILHAAVMQRQNNMAGAIECLKPALELGHAQTYRRTFLDEADLVRPLLSACCCAGDKLLPEHLQSYAQSLLRALVPQDCQDQSNSILSVRELEVLHELRLGNSNKIIARKLDLSEATVKFHVGNIFRKLKVRKRAAAVAEAHRHGLLS